MNKNTETHDKQNEEQQKAEKLALQYVAQMGANSVLREIKELYTRLSSIRRQFFLSLAVNICLSILLMLMFVAFLSYPKTKYIPTKDNSAICEVYPSDNPNITDATIREFGKDAILNLYTFDYMNYEDQMNDVLARNFTPKGKDATVRAMESAGIFEYVKENALVFKASAINAARIEKKDINEDGKDYWVVRFPMVLDIYSGKETPIDTQKHMVTVRVVADTASTANPNGLGISSVTLAPL